jgi:predicted O-linked N-acetylglucosamine transferase (SPINDLY family)
MRRSTSALAMLSLSDDPEAQLAAARQFVKNKVRSDVPALSVPRSYGHQKIRVAYGSSDFCLHPIAMLTAELFELHDRERFEVYGFCWTRQGHSALRQRIIDAMDHFESIESLTDEAAARLIREHEIDVLIDLHGQTLGARPNLLAWRPAPIQITYLGLPATTGLPSIDHVIADRFLIPEEHAAFYSEKPLYMPDVYQVSDRRRQHAPIPNRTDCHLPAEGFVFCSFNNNYKYTPETFDIWMNLLRRVPGSVLWLLSDNPWAEANLRNEAKTRNIDAGRLIFAPRVAPDQYLARYAVADLFLDSFPFNAGTTANDALWMGLPVLTRSGRSFASRMAGALLTAAGLSELITYNPRDYEEKAVALAQTPGECRRLRDHLREVHLNGVLFDTPRFVRHLEDHLQRLVAELG